jgi:glycosyltransferase involved in cell wall biosynthesis
MAAFDLFVLPSLAEGISNTILEAMACGLPVVATDVGGNAELVDSGTTGTLVASDDADAMARTLSAYARDPSRVVAEGRAARDRAVSRFGIDTMVSHYLELYDGLLAQRRPQAASSASASVQRQPG